MHIFSLSILIPFLSPLPTLKVLPSVSFTVSQPLINYVINWAATMADREHQLGSDPQSGLRMDARPLPHHFCSPLTAICPPLPPQLQLPSGGEPIPVHPRLPCAVPPDVRSALPGSLADTGLEGGLREGRHSRRPEEGHRLRDQSAAVL